MSVTRQVAEAAMGRAFDDIEVCSDIANIFVEEVYRMDYEGKVQVKERPRVRSGRVFTPEKTRKFEASVRKWAKENWDRGPVLYPIRVRLIIAEETNDEDLAKHSFLGLVYNDKGDIDNLAKSILDGMNGIVYKDDKQICSLTINRMYKRKAGFTAVIERAGLTPLEYRNFRALMKREG